MQLYIELVVELATTCPRFEDSVHIRLKLSCLMAAIIQIAHPMLNVCSFSMVPRAKNRIFITYSGTERHFHKTTVVDNFSRPARTYLPLGGALRRSFLRMNRSCDNILRLL
jgi:hypothetical protein